MTKNIPPGAWPGLSDQIQLEAVKIASSGLRGNDFTEFAKRASHPLATWVRGYKPLPGEYVAHLLALGSTEKVGQNRNADAYGEAMLERDHPTFEKLARVYLNHCFAPDTEVVLGDRRRVRIDTISSGDQVMTPDGPKRVSDVYVNRYCGTILHFKLEGLPKRLTATPNHPIFAIRRESLFTKHGYCRLNTGTSGSRSRDWDRPVEGDYVQAGELLPGDYVAIPLPKLGGEPIDRNFAELVGYVAADGSIHDNGAVQFTLKRSRKISAIESLADRLGVALSKRRRSDDGCWAISFSNQELATKLRKFITGTDTEKTLTEEVFKLDADSIQRIIGAFIDGDGNFSKNNRGLIRIRSSSPAMRSSLCDCIRALGVPCSVQIDSPRHTMRGLGKYRNRVYQTNESGCVNISNRYASIVAKYATTKVDYPEKMKTMPTIWGNFQIVKVTSRDESDYDGMVYNLKVPGPESYLAGEILVHNCNRDPKQSYGVVKKSHFDKQLGRVELIIALNATKEAADRNEGLVAERTLNKLANNIDVAVSQSCFVPGSRVWTDTYRFMPIENVAIGQKLTSHHGNVGTVNALIPKHHDGEVVRFRAVGLPDPVVCTPDHKIWTRPTAKGKTPKCPVCGGQFKSLNAHLWQKKDPQHQRALRDYGRAAEGWTRAEDLVVGDFVRTPFDTQIEEPGDAVYAELLGYYLSEGCTWEYSRFAKGGRDCYKGVDFIFSRSEDDTFVARTVELCKQLGYTKISLRRQQSRPNTTTVRVSSAELARRLLADGGRYSYGKEIADRIMRWSPEVQLKIVARFMDGDGNWNPINEILSGTTVSERLAYQLAAICWRNNIPANITTVRKPKGGRRQSYTIAISQRYASAVGSDKVPADHTPITHSPTVLGHLRFQQAGGVSVRATAALQTYIESGFVYRRIRKISREEYCGPVYDLSVPGDTSYTVSGIGVSNCFVPGDHCTSCDHFARNRSEYCGPQNCKYGGCRDNLGRVFDDGFQLGVDNRDCKFFDISDVSDTRGADRTAFITGKVAEVERTIGGAQLAEMLGIVAPEHLLDPRTIAAASSLRKLAAMGAPQHAPASSWDECLAVRGRRNNGFCKAASFPNDDHGRHTMLSELAADGVILPPSRWLAAITGGPVDKCASVFARGVSPQRLLDRSDLHDKLAEAQYADDSRLSSPGSYAWMSPTRAAHGEESASAAITGPAKIASTQAPANVVEEAELRYLAYQAGVLAKHAHRPEYGALLAECARHNTGLTV